MLRRASTARSRLPDSGNIQKLLSHWRKLFWLSVAGVVLLVGDAALTRFGPPRVVTVILREWQKAGMPSVATAASFSVSAGSFTTPAKAATFGAALDVSGMPILIRVRPEDNRYQVLVGPYVSTDEAEHAQRRLGAWGLGESRLVVDDTMRSPATASVFGIGGQGNSIVMISAPGMSSVVFEMTDAPKTIEAKRTSVATIDVTIGAGADPVGPSTAGDQADAFETLALPDGVSLVHDLSVRNWDNALHAHVVVPGEVQSRLRLEGTRVYLDLAWPTAPWTLHTRVRSAGDAASATTRETSEGAAGNEGYDDRIKAIAARFDQIAPFLVSAAEAPDADVLSALAHSLDGVRESLAAVTAPPDREAMRQAMLAAVVRASTAMAPVFDGDRAGAVREAIAQFGAGAK